MKILEVLPSTIVLTLNGYDGIRIIGDPEIRDIKSHNQKARKNRRK